MTSLLTEDIYEKGKIKVRVGQKVYAYFVGGVTVGEIQALRLLSKKLKIEIMICTTEQTNGAQIIKNCFE